MRRARGTGLSFWLLVAAGFLAGVACSSSPGTPSGSDGGTTSQVVGASGGTVTASDGTQITIPPGALASDVTITIALNPEAPALTQGTSIAPAHVFGPEGQQFLAPVSVTLTFAQADLPQGATEQQLVVYTAPQGSGDYQPLPTTVVDATHVAGQTTHFSNVCPGVPHMATDAGGGDAPFDAAGCPAAGGIDNQNGVAACAATSCCAQLTTCFADPACSPIGACFEANCQISEAGDDTVIVNCAAQCAADGSASGASEFNAAFDCIHTLCGVAPAGDSGGGADSGPTDSGGPADAGADAGSCPAASGIENLDGARDCASASCCAQLTTCLADSACAPLGACFEANCQYPSVDAGQVQSCAAQCAADGSANGVAEFDAAFNCIHASCGGSGDASGGG